jgi:hypothetical protein
MAYPLLSKTNIVTSNTIQAADVSQSINAFTGTANYQIRISGSLNIIGSMIYTGPNDDNKGGFTGSLFGTASYAITSSYGYAYTGSNTTSASFTYNSSYTSGSLYGFTVRSSSDNYVAALTNIGMLSGTSYIRQGDPTKTISITATPFPLGATLGENVWITVSQFDNQLGPTDWDGYVAVRSITTSSIEFQTRRNNNASRDLPFTFICVYQTS